MAPGDRISVLVVDDDDLLAAAVAALLETEERIEHVGRARTGEEAIALVAALDPDIVVMDVEMPGIGGLEATHRITTGGGHAGPSVLVVTGAYLRRVQARLQRVLDTTPVAIAEVQADGRIAYANAAAAGTLRMSEAEMTREEVEAVLQGFARSPGRSRRQEPQRPRSLRPRPLRR